MSKNNPVSYRPSDLDSPFGIFQAFVSQYLGGRLAVLQPVQIVSTDGQFATVQPLIAHYDTSGQPIQITSADNIPNIPVVQPFGANGQFQFKPEPGDKGLLIACNWDTSKYKQTHGATTVGSNRQFNWSDGFFLPVDFSAAPTGALIKNGGSSIAVEKDAVDIKTGTMTITGDVVITGNITLTGSMTASDEVTAKGVALSAHTHQFNYNAGTVPTSATTLIPTPGA